MLDLETLEAECEELLSTIRRIDLQLSERQPVGRVPDDEYREWRGWRAAALHAKSKATTKYRAKRKALKEARHAANMPPPASGGASLDALRALVGAAAVQLRDDLDATPRRPATALDRLAVLAPELLAVVEAAKRRLDAGHNDTCDRVRPSVRLCSCGASGLLAATEALDAKLDEVAR